MKTTITSESQHPLEYIYNIILSVSFNTSNFVSLKSKFTSLIISKLELFNELNKKPPKLIIAIGNEVNKKPPKLIITIGETEILSLNKMMNNTR